MTQAFLPSVRKLVASRLRSDGFTQSRISRFLGVTQASVSIYLSADPRKAYDALSSLSVPRAEADEFARRLAAAVTRGAPDGVGELTAIWSEVLGRGGACGAHRDMYPSLSDCDVCIRAYGPRGGSLARTIAEVSEAVKMIEGSEGFAAVMPEVSVNIACAAEGASSPAEVVAVPGRIVKVKDRPRSMLPPEAGASAHMSKVLLLARSRLPDVRACINLRHDRRMAAAMKRAGIRTVSIESGTHRGEDDPTVSALGEKLSETKGAFEAVVDLGGAGIEPNVYLFGSSARDVASAAVRLARVYSAA